MNNVQQDELQRITDHMENLNIMSKINKSHNQFKLSRPDLVIEPKPFKLSVPQLMLLVPCCAY